MAAFSSEWYLWSYFLSLSIESTKSLCTAEFIADISESSYEYINLSKLE